MNYEEKYKKALKVIEELYTLLRYQSSSDALLASQTIEKAFPELKESEDERVRKAIIEFFELQDDNTTYSFVPKKDILAWLERQDDKAIPKNIDDAALQYVDTCDVDGKFTHDNITEPCWNNHSMMAAYKAGWLEKQYEKKTEIKYVYPKFRIGDVIEPIKPNGFYRPVRVLSIEEKTASYYCESDDKKSFSSIPIRCENEYKLVEQKPADEVEPKFKVGDWIVYEGLGTYKVVEIHEGWYSVIDSNDRRWSVMFEKESLCHLWTIQDAKDGDALFTSSTASHETFIFKSIDEIGKVKCYFAYDSEDGFREGIYHFIGGATNCKPATKEQRDLLFQKMHEAGYEWDADKKELNKIEKQGEQKPIIIIPQFKVGDIIKPKPYNEEHLIKDINENGYVLDVDIIIPFNDEDVWEIVKQKPTWSEDDEKMINLLIKIFEVNHPNEHFKVNPIGTTSMEAISTKEIVDWLKSLKPNHWRPSEEQIRALNAINMLGELSYVGQGGLLVKLYQDLKKL